MTPQEKAKELFEKFIKTDKKDNYSFVGNQVAKECAIIAVDEILNNNCGTNTDGQQAYKEEIYCDEYFWHDVKLEVERF